MQEIKIERILMKRSEKNPEKLIGGLKNFSPDGKFEGERVVIGNDLPQEGKYRVTCREMKSGKGYIVTEWELLYDQPTFLERDGEVIFLVNGKEEKLRGENGKRFPLWFNPAKFFPKDILWKNIRKKLNYLFLHPDFSQDALYEEFIQKTEKAEREYKKRVISESKNEKNGGELEISELDKLREKFRK